MRQILIIDNSFEKYHQFRQQLEEHLTVEVTTVDEIDKAISLLHILPQLDFILIDSVLKGQERLSKVEAFLMEEKLETAVFVIGKCQKVRPQTIVIDYDLDSPRFIEVIKDQFLKNDLLKNARVAPLFVPVDFHFLVDHQESRFPVAFYLRISRPDDDYQYLKRLHPNDLFTKQEIEKLQKHNVTNLYVLKNDYKAYLETSLKLSCQNKPESSVLQKSFDYHLTKEIIALAGIDDETSLLVKANIFNMESSISKNESLVNYLKLALQNHNSYSYARSMLVALILSKVVNQFEWSSKIIKEKICYVAFFHDISIVDDRLTRVHSEDELLEKVGVEYEFQSHSKLVDKKFKDYEVEQIQLHAMNSALILEKIPSVPDGVFQIVKEHHGSKNGIGFKNHQSISLQPLSMIFIVVEDFVVQFLRLENPSKDEIKKILQEFTRKYIKGNYKKAVDSLIEISK